MSKCEKLERFSNSEKCVFCETNFVDELKYGSIHKYEDIIVHYFCLLLSSSMEQNGQDEDGIYGFLPQDIKKEIKRGKKLRCTVCRKSGATLGCTVAKCKTVFHLPCGLSRGSLHQFYGQFKSFCVTHRPRQRISDDVLKKARLEPATCVICYDNVILNDDSTMWAPCCKKNAFFHRICVQKLANSFGGYAFRCPLCNDQQIFTKAMKDFGIFVPDRDASWEQEENAFNELLYRHDRCDAQKCICPHGRKYNKKGVKWCITLCHLCGSQGIHRGCRLQKTPEWHCDNCLTMLQNAEKESSSDGESNSGPLTTTTPLEHNWRNSGGSFRSSDPCSSNNMLPITTAPIKITRRKLKRDEFSTSPSPTSSRSSSRSRSSSKSSLSDERGAGRPKNKVSVQQSPSVSPLPQKQRSPSASSLPQKQRSPSLSPLPRKRSSSSSSVISVPVCPSPIIVIESDSESEDVEVVADVSRSILLNREGNKIQIVQIVPEVEPEGVNSQKKVEIQGDLNVKEVCLDLGVKMSTCDSKLPERPESIFKRRRKNNSSTSVSSEGTSCSSIIDTETVVKNKHRLKSISPSSTMNSKGLSTSSINVKNFYNENTYHEPYVSRIPNSTTISGVNFNPSDEISQKDINKTSVCVSSESDVPERKYTVYTPPNRGSLQIKTVESLSTDTPSKTEDLKLPPNLIVKFRDPKIETVRTPCFTSEFNSGWRNIPAVQPTITLPLLIQAPGVSYTIQPNMEQIHMPSYTHSGVSASRKSRKKRSKRGTANQVVDPDIITLD